MAESTVITHPHEYYVDLVRRSPKVPPNQWTSEEQGESGHVQFGNNFYLLFEARLGDKRAADPQEYRRTEALPQDYLIPVETKYPGQWKRFLEQNRPLVRQIDSALDDLRPYQEVFHYVLEVRKEAQKSGDWSRIEELSSLDAEGVGTYAWRQLNPLLEKAAIKMKQAGINPQEFFG